MTRQSEQIGLIATNYYNRIDVSIQSAYQMLRKNNVIYANDFFFAGAFDCDRQWIRSIHFRPFNTRLVNKAWKT